jgi:thymidylate synthase (FAD)
MTEPAETDITFRDDMTVICVDGTGGDSSVISAARVSTDPARALAEIHDDPAASAGLINYLMKSRHGSPFEHNSMTFYIEAPIFVFREFHRHRTGWSYNETSGRYRQLDPVFYIPSPDRPLVQQGKPGHYDFVPGSPDQLRHTVKAIRENAYDSYTRYIALLNEGVAREVARSVLPVGTYSAMYATCNARSLMHFIALRTKHPDAAYASYPQREIEMVAEQMEEAWAKLMPLSYEAFNRHGRVCP